LSIQEVLEKEYRYKRSSYEEQEVELMKQRDKALSIIEEVRERSLYYLKDVIFDKDLLLKGHRHAEQMKENIIELTNENRNEITRKIEKLDIEYYSKLRSLDEYEK